jgi:hypothetical protein
VVFAFFACFGSGSVVTVNLDYRLRADDGAHGAARTVAVICLGGKVPISVGFLRDDNAASRAGCNTQAAALALFGINSYFASHLGDYAHLSFQFSSKKDFSRTRLFCKAKRQPASVYNRDAKGKKRFLCLILVDFLIPSLVFEVWYPSPFNPYVILIEIAWASPKMVP